MKTATKTETLHTCPNCLTTGFTKRGLAAHKCDGKSRNAAKPASSEIVVSSAEDQLMGQQLTEQFGRAVGGTKEVLKFGAMMMMLRDRLLKSTCGLKLPRGVNSDGGVAAWLKEFAPSVKKATAYRFLHVAESIAEEYQEYLPAKVTFVALASTPVDQLPDKLKKKQAELFDWVSGTSQRSWLDRWKPDPEKGGKRTKSKELTPEEQEKLAREDAHEMFRSIHKGLFSLQHGDAAKLAWLPLVADDITKEMDLAHLETGLIGALTAVQEELMRRGAKVTKIK